MAQTPRQAMPAAKCASCAADVSSSRRFKDASGRLFCATCADGFRSKRASAARAPDDGTIALADDAPAATPPKYVGPRDLELCPDCGTPWGSSVVCTKCGFNRHKGEHMGTHVPDPAGTSPLAPKPHTPRPCRKCKYDLTGLKTARCPECGTVNPRLKIGGVDERAALREMYIKPLVMIGAGVIVATFAHAVVGLLFKSAGLGVSPGLAALAFLIFYAVSVVVGFLVYVGCSLIFIGFDEPLGVTFVRLAAVFAVTDAVGAVLGPIPVVGWPIQGLVLIGLLMSVMELDLEDAWIVAGAIFFAHFAMVALFIYLVP